MSARARVLAPLASTTVRRIAWWSALGCIAGAVALVWLVAAREHAPDHHVISAFRWATVLLAGGIAGVLDDPTEDDLAGVPTPVWWRRSLALLTVTVPTAAAWAATFVIVDRPLPWAALSIEAAALVLLGCAVASTRPLRRSNLPAGLTATMPPAVLLVAAGFLPAHLELLADPAATGAWRQAHLRWTGLVVLALVALATTARDRARRSTRRVIRPARGRPPQPSATATTDGTATTLATANHLSEAS